MQNIETIKNCIVKLEEIINYTYKDKNNVLLALTHSSYANENKSERLSSNERLEFLGDAVLNIIISEYIYKNHTNLTEGEMTKARASIVCEASLMKCANGIGLGKYLILGKGEELSGGRLRTSILSDAFEALIGSIYLDGGIQEARNFIYRFMMVIIDSSISGDSYIDYKTLLQEMAQKSSDQRIQYEILEEKGPDHNKLFVAQVKVADRILGLGEGKSKKEAEQKAAQIALSKIQEVEHV
jgi:ribonuclease III